MDDLGEQLPGRRHRQHPLRRHRDPELRVFPSRNLGLFLKGGAGLGLTYASVDYGNSTSESGFATNLGAGWEIKLGREIFLTPGVDWYQHSFQKRDDDTLYERLFNVSLAVIWQPGR